MQAGTRSEVPGGVWLRVPTTSIFVRRHATFVRFVQILTKNTERRTGRALRGPYIASLSRHMRDHVRVQRGEGDSAIGVGLNGISDLALPLRLRR